ncbi:MAG: helix-turn-helix domain-containing protein [Leptolyngbyaceae cyanobacterium bins.349]|nr:helix-turn-helix domain-containing protein [Leptolyngbyaceae cyanobacterium bins.349]
MQSLDPCGSVQCPIQFVVDLIGSKWSILILRELFAGDRRTHQLLHALPGLSTKILMQRLRELERHGLVERRVYAEVPPHVEYSLTSKGQEIQPILSALRELGHRWLQQDLCICPMDLEDAVSLPETSM